jgi:hypothetical protein
MRLAKLGKPSYLKGRKLSVEHIEKLRVSHLGQVAWNKGLPFNSIVRQKMSAAKKGKVSPHKGKKGFGGFVTHPEARYTGTPVVSKGKDHWRYIQDRTKLRKADDRRFDYAHKDWIKAVRTRDHNKCKISDETCGGRIETHHILNWIDFPEQRYSVNNGITLCRNHHPRGRVKEYKLSPYFQALILKQ